MALLLVRPYNMVCVYKSEITMSKHCVRRVNVLTTDRAGVWGTEGDLCVSELF